MCLDRQEVEQPWMVGQLWSWVASGSRRRESVAVAVGRLVAPAEPPVRLELMQLALVLVRGLQQLAQRESAPGLASCDFPVLETPEPSPPGRPSRFRLGWRTVRLAAPRET